MRTNEGFEIISAVRMPNGTNEEIVIGRRDTAISPYVCWRCKNGDDYYWGHYFDNYDAALTDMIGRLTNGKEWTLVIYYYLCNAENQSIEQFTARHKFDADTATDLVNEVNNWWYEFKKENGYDDNNCWISYVKEV